MVVYEQLEGGLVRAYSDAGFLIHGGMPEADCEEAIDPADAGRVYTETDIPIHSDDEDEPVEPVESDEEATIEDYQAALEELGVSL